MNTDQEDHPKRRTAFRRKEDRLLRKQIDTYIKLFNIGQVITSEMNFDALFDVIADQTNRILDSQRCSVFLIDDKGTYLTTFVSTDIKRNEIRIPCSHGIAGWVFSNQLPLASQLILLSRSHRKLRPLVLVQHRLLLIEESWQKSLILIFIRS